MSLSANMEGKSQKSIQILLKNLTSTVDIIPHPSIINYPLPSHHTPCPFTYNFSCKVENNTCLFLFFFSFLRLTLNQFSTIRGDYFGIIRAMRLLFEN